MLHVGADEQKARLQERLDNPEKHYKFNPGDLDERALWPAYREAYEIALERTNTDAAPWHVIPADKKWFRNLAVAQLLLDALRGLDLAVAGGRLRRRGAAATAGRRGTGRVIASGLPS